MNLTPGEWKEQKREEKKQRKLERRRIAVSWQAKGMASWPVAIAPIEVDARMGEIEERMHAEIEAEEQAFKEKEEKEKRPGSDGFAKASWVVCLLSPASGRVGVARKRPRRTSKRNETKWKHAGAASPAARLMGK